MTTIKKKCAVCGVEKPATTDFFYKHERGLYGLRRACIPCKRTKDNNYAKTETSRAIRASYVEANREHRRKVNRDYRKTHKSTDSVRKWRALNPERQSESVKKCNQKRMLDPAHALRLRIARRLRALLGNGKASSTETLLGYTRDELKRHIERQFVRGMTWEAFLRGEIHIDHIVPISSFRINSVDDPEFKACWSLANLRPMWAAQNIAKGAKRISLL